MLSIAPHIFLDNFLLTALNLTLKTTQPLKTDLVVNTCINLRHQVNVEPAPLLQQVLPLDPGMPLPLVRHVAALALGGGGLWVGVRETERKSKKENEWSSLHTGQFFEMSIYCLGTSCLSDASTP